ncbi:MAG: alpha/beta hydrolase [Pseudomonadota bacterium]
MGITAAPTTHHPRRHQAGASVRVLIIPGLHNSGPDHWQTWLQTQYHDAVRVKQPHWDRPDLDGWAQQIALAMDRHADHITWVAVAHSFGCLALARYLDTRTPSAQNPGGIRAALMAAPADPVKFDVAQRLPTQGLGIDSTVIGSENDPWMSMAQAQLWAQRWGARFLNIGAAGHINHESGFGPWPLARFKVDQLIRDQQRQRRLERVRSLEQHSALFHLQRSL